MKEKKSNIYSRLWRLNHLYHIINKQGKDQIFKLNDWQKKLYNLEMKLRDAWKRVWIKLLKARQIWFTTYKYIDKLDKVMFYSNTTVNIVAHNREKLQEIFKKVKYTYESVPDKIEMSDWNTWIKPQPKYDNVNELYFKEKNSTIKITLDSRSWTLTDCHISEWAFIDKFQDMLRATLPASEQADITIETTANWMNEFKSFWDRDTRFTQIFIPRFDNLEYEMKAPDWYECMEELKYLQERYKLTDNQMFWYEDKYKNDRDWTLQEYPSEPIDAFLSSWRPFYPVWIMKDRKITVWEVDELYPDLIRYNKQRNKDALYWIDLAEWLDHWDYHVIRVRDRDLNLIASYRSNKVDPWDVTKIVNYIWNCWIEWVVAPERNNHWHTFLYASKAYSWYNRIYIPKQDKDDLQDTKKWQRWWHTNLATRPVMLDEHKEMVRDWLLEIDQDLFNECMTFVTINRKPQADDNCNDDVVMADAICCQMTKERTSISSPIPEWKVQSFNDYLGL